MLTGAECCLHQHGHAPSALSHCKLACEHVQVTASGQHLPSAAEHNAAWNAGQCLPRAWHLTALQHGTEPGPDVSSAPLCTTVGACQRAEHLGKRLVRRMQACAGHGQLLLLYASQLDHHWQPAPTPPSEFSSKLTLQRALHDALCGRTSLVHFRLALPHSFPSPYNGNVMLVCLPTCGERALHRSSQGALLCPTVSGVLTLVLWRAMVLLLLGCAMGCLLVGCHLKLCLVWYDAPRSDLAQCALQYLSQCQQHCLAILRVCRSPFRPRIWCLTADGLPLSAL